MSSTALRRIIALDEKRILSRLRSKHAAPSRKTRSKPPLPELLHRAINDPSMPSATTSGEAWMGIQIQVSPICETFRQLESLPLRSHDTEALQHCLFDVVGHFAAVDTTNLQAVLAMARKLDPTLKTALPRAVSKLARYREIAADLVNAARGPDGMLLQRIRIEILQHPPPSTIQSQADYHVALSRITNMKNRGYLARYPLTSLPTLETGFQRRIARMSDRKVHAEIQLLLYYEQALLPPSQRPRIICSSKDACYMCWHFIRAHGQFHVPSTHGTIYDLWTLPFQVDVTDEARNRIQNAAATLNARMESKILQTLSQNLRAFPQPNESTLFLREPYDSTSTIANLQSSPSIASSRGPSEHKRHSTAPSLIVELAPRHNESAAPLEASLGSYGTQATEDTPPTNPLSVPHRVHQLPDTPTIFLFPRRDGRLTLLSERITVSASHDPSMSPPKDHVSSAEPPLRCCIRAHTVTTPSAPIETVPSFATDDENIEYVDVRQLPLDNVEEVKLQAGSLAGKKVLALVNGRRIVMLKFVLAKEDAE